MSRTTSRKSRHSSQPESVPILSAAYLKNAKSKKDIISRLTAITNALESDPELDPSDTPGLASLSTLLVQPDSFLHHKDSDVRLHTLLACMELFYVYAPEPPWDEEEILDIFRVMVRMLASLGHTLESSGGGIDGGGTGGNSAEASSGGNSNNYEHYFRILELLSEVKIGVVLVELVRATPTDLDPSAEEELRQEALETLCDLIRTIITCVHVDHPPEVAAHAEVAVSACIEEFDGSVPVQVLDEILVFVGAGPIQWVTNPAAVRAAAAVALAKKKRQPPPFPQSEMPPAQIQQTNPQYLVAAKIIRRTEDKISSPIAALLNGLLSGDTDVVTSISVVDLTETTTTDARGKTVSTPSAAAITSTGQVAHTGADVWSITYELHRIAPQILTTVIGTVASSLVYPEVGPRWRATKLLGRLFAARSSSIAVKFRICFSQWLRRSADTEQKIRETMVKGLVSFLTNKSHETDLCQDVNESLATILTKDPSLDVRLLAIRQVCELAHNATNDAISDTPAMTSSSATSNTTNPPSRTHAHDISVISAELLLAVANRVSSKNKTERRDAITGLAQIFHKHYIRKILRHVQDGGDDCDIEVILRVLHEHCSEEQNKKYKFVAEAEEKFGWIPQKVFECVYFSDATDPELRNRIYQIVDDVLLDGGLTATSRAVGLAIILHGLKKKGKENAFKWMCALFSQRSQLQRALGLYLDARVKAKGCEAGSAEAFTADAEAMEKLEVVASLSSPLVGISSSNSDSSADMASVLKKIHTAKDKHIFRILSTIASPTHSPSARKRAFDELPKRTKGMGAASVAWTKALARRCSMGAFVNFESIEHCIILAQESFEANDCEVSSLFLTCVKTMIASFPALAATKDSFKNLVEFLEVVRTDVTPEAKKELEKYGIVTLISDILAKSASSMPASDVTKGKGHGDDEDTISIYETLRSQLLRLCKNDGTPEQARNSVHALSSLVNPVSQHLSLPSRVKKEKKEFEPLLKALVAPSRLAIPDDSMTSKQKSKIVSVLSAIAAVAECAPYAFNSTGQGKTPLCWGERAIDFSLNAVLLGKDTSSNLSNEEYSSDSGSESENESPAKGRRSSTARGNKTAVASSKGNDKVNISVHCRMICAAIEVLICHIRATIVRAKADGAKSELEAPSTEHIAKVFKTLIEILEQNGRPPSSQNERYCKTTQDQAELRRCAATNLLRLCDANLQLENTHLTPKMWHILSSAFLDKDIHARESIMEELSYMLTGSGKFRHNASSYPPSLRFVALVSLCPDGDHGAHSAANGYAANVGRRANSIKVAATQCIKSLRVTCQATAAQCRSLGREAEKNFEHRLKMKLMPEYSVPYALHLLSFRHETASSGGTLPGDTDDNFSVDAVVSSEASNRMLKKRLKWLFDPLIQSLGAGADNISFLLRMVELLSKCYPVDVEFKKSDDDLSIEDDLHDKEQKHASARLKIITMAARDVLLSYVKKDVNLSAYPGAIFLPGDLFKKSSSVITSSPAYHDSSEDELVEKSKTPAKATNTTDRAKRPSAEKNSSQKRKTVKPVVNEAFDDDMSEESFTKHTRECGSGGSRRSLRSNKNHERSIDSSPGVADAFGDGISPIKAFPSSPVHLSSESLDESPQQPTPELKKRSLKASRSRKDPPKSESTVSEKKLRRQPDPVIVAKRSEDDAEEEESSVESPSKKPKLRKSTEGPMDKFVKRPSRDSAKKRSSYGTNSFAKKDEKKDKKRQGRGDPIVAVERRGSKVQDDAPLDDESKISQSSEESDEMPAKNLRNSRKKQNTVGTAPTSSTSTVPASGSSKKKSRLRVDPVLSVQRSGKSSQEDAFSDENSRISESSADSEKNAKNLRNGVKKNNTGRATPKSTSITRALASNEKKSRRRLDPALTVKRSGSMSKEDAPSDDESKFSQSSAKSEEKSTKPLLSGRNKEPTRKLTPKSVSNTHASVINKRKPRRGVDPVLAVQRSGKKPKEDDLTEDESESCLLSKESEKKPSKPLANGIRNESKGQATSKSASDTPVSESRGRKSRRKKDPVLERKRARMKSHDEVLSDDESEASQSSVESEEKPKQHLSNGKKKQNRGKASAKSASSTPASETSEKKTRRKVDPVLVPKWGGLKSQKIFLLDDQSKSSQSSVESKGKPSKPPTNNQNKKQSKGRASPKSASNTPVSETSGKKSRRKVDAVLMGKRSGNKENVDIESKTKKSIKNETMDYSDYYDDGDDEFDFPSDDLPPKKNASKKQAKKAAPARKAVKAKISMGPNGLSPKVSPSSASKSSTRSLRSKTRRVR